ncbi:MAG: HAD family hydrolase [Actinomycetota bacterium]|nr:HAD family hydrolase [Actinomycetota bacterium]
MHSDWDADWELVVFDCDGVLVDSERLTVTLEARLLTELGWPMSESEVVQRWMGRAAAAQLTEVGDRLGAATAEQFDRRLTTELERAFATELRPVAGIPRLLDHLTELGVASCVASSGTPARMALTLGATGLLSRFEGRIFSAVEVEHGKPAPDLFLLAAERMGVAPERCVVVEDSVPGVRAAVEAGMHVFGYARGLANAEDLRTAGAEVFDDMTVLARRLGAPCR